MDNSTSNGTWDISTGTGGGGGGRRLTMMSDCGIIRHWLRIPAWAGTAVNVIMGQESGDYVYARGVILQCETFSADSDLVLPPGL